MESKKLNGRQTQVAIKTVKDYFQTNLAKALNLTRVSAPLFVRPETGLNDNLSGVERPVSFNLGQSKINVEIVQSLAKWKRFALLRYGFAVNEGLYTDMNAIRADEDLDEVHSIYVDQWDWEKVIEKENRNKEYLYDVVRKIYEVFKATETMVNEKYEGYFSKKLPDEIFFITSQELLDKYPTLDSKEREKAICKEKKAVFIQGIGCRLSDGNSHDMRSPDYDDWTLNGDILFWNPVLNDAIELSSMGIRVDRDVLLKQLKISNKEDRIEKEYHQNLINEKLPLTIGGGIGQSRICMYMLEKRHIGEVQASVWDDKNIEFCKENGIDLL